MTRVVCDEAGNQYVLEKQSAESSRVRDPETGERRHLPNADLSPVEGASPLRIVAGGLPTATRALVTAVPDERALGLVVELDARGPTRVRTLLDMTDLCESDLHGMLVALVAGDLLAETAVAGERGYETTDLAREALDQVR